MESSETTLHIPYVSDFAADKVEMVKNRKIILLEFMAEDCPYCHALEERFLLPMIRSGEYDERVLFRQIQHDDPYGAIVDFDGKRIYNEGLSERYNINLTPTMVFLGTDGEQLVKKMVGLGPEDYFLFYIEESINKSLEKLLS